MVLPRTSVSLHFNNYLYSLICYASGFTSFSNNYAVSNISRAHNSVGYVALGWQYDNQSGAEPSGRGALFVRGKKFTFSTIRPPRLWGPPSFSVYGELYPRGGGVNWPGRETDDGLRSNFVTKSAQWNTSNQRCAFRMSCLIKHGETFCFLLGKHPPVGQGLLIHDVSKSHNDAPQSVGLLWTSDQFVVETST